MTQNSLQAAALPWYARASYPRVLEVMQDRAHLPPSYDEWLARAEVVVEQARRKGYYPLKTHVDPDHFVAWCEAHGCEPDSDSRMEFIETLVLVNTQHGTA
jgi:hypothetical protein